MPTELTDNDLRLEYAITVVPLKGRMEGHLWLCASYFHQRDHGKRKHTMEVDVY